MCEHHDSNRKNHEQEGNTGINWRRFLTTGAAVSAAAAATAVVAPAARAADNPYAPPAKGALPPSNMKLNIKRTALVISDPQVDFLSPKGVTWGVVGKSVTQHNTVENVGCLFKAAKAAGITVAISPHYYYPTDKGWRFEGALEKLMYKIGMFDRPSAYDMTGFDNSGADFMPEPLRQELDGPVLAIRRRKKDVRGDPLCSGYPH